MAGIKQIEASQRPPLSKRLDALDKQEAEEAEITDKDKSPLSASEMAGLGEMDAEALRGLLQRVCDAAWGSNGLTGQKLVETALQSDDECYASLMLKAATIAKNTGDAKVFETLARFWVEQTKGKPVQRIQQTTTLTLEQLVLQAYAKPLLIEQGKSDKD